MSSAKKFVITIGADYEGKSELKDLQADLKAIAQIDSFEKLRASSKKAEAALILARKQAYEFGQAMMKGGGEKAERKYAAAVREVEKLSVAFDKQKGKIYAAETALKKQGTALSDLSGKYKTLQSTAEAQGRIIAAQMALGVRPIKNIHSEIDGLKQAYKHLQTSGTQSVKELAIAKDRLRIKVAALRKETNGWTSHLGRIRDGWAGLLVTAGAVAGAFRGIQFFAGFDDSMREVQAFTQASSGEIQKFSDLAKNLGAKTRFTATEVAQGMAELTQSGIKSYKELAGILPDVTNLTSASGMQFKETADMLTDTMKQFGLATSESGRVADVIAKGYTSAGHSAQQLGAALSYVGPVSKQMGYSLEDTVAILDTLAEASYKGQRGGVALRGGFTRLIKPVGEAEGILEKYNIQVEDSEGNIRNFADIIEDLGDASLTTKEMMILFGQEAGPGMMALVDQGADSIRDFQTAMEGAEGTAKTIAETMETGLGGSLRSLMSSLQAVVIGFGDSLAPAIQMMADGFTLLSRGVAVLPKPVMAVAALAGAMGTAFAAWHLGFKHIHSAMMLAYVDLASFAAKAKAATLALTTGLRQMTVALVSANPVLAILAGALIVGATAWAVFGKSSLENSREHADAADKIGKARAAIDEEVTHLEKLQKTLSETAVGTREHAEAEAELAGILPDANLSLDEQGRMMVRVGDATEENSKKLQTYIDLKKEESRTQFALQIEQQATAYFEAGNAVDKYKDNLIEWYGVGEASTSVVQDLWRNLNRITGTYGKNIAKGSEMRSNLIQQKSGYEALLKSLLRTGATTEQVSEMLSSIHMDEGTMSKILSRYQTMVSGVTTAGKNSATEIQQATEQSADAQKQAQIAALDAMKAKYQQYADKVKSLQDELADHQKSMKERLRSMGRTGMSDIDAWEDRKKEAQEYEAAAVSALEAANKAVAEGDNDKANQLFEDVKENAKSAEDAFADLNKEVKKGDEVLVSKQEGLNTATTGLKRAGEVLEEAIRNQQDAMNNAMEDLSFNSGFEDLTEGMDESKKKWLENWKNMRSATMQELDKVEQRIVKVSTDRYATLYINEVVQKATGGAIGMHLGGMVSRAARMAGGGHNIGNALNGFHFPGFGGGDRPKNLVMAEDGEVMLNKFSVRQAGLKAALAFNAGNWKVVMAELTKRFSSKMRLGGPVGRMSLPSLPVIPMQSGMPITAGAGPALSGSLRPIILPPLYGGATVHADSVNVNKIMSAIDKARRTVERFGQ